MSGPDMMQKCRNIVSDAVAEGITEEAVKERLKFNFPGGDMDSEAHAEIRRCGIRLFQLAIEERRYTAQAVAPEAEPEQDPWALTIASLALGMKLKIKEGDYSRWVRVSEITRNGDELRIILKRATGPKWRLIEGHYMTPLQKVEFLIEVPALDWERDYSEGAE